ncbi:MAG: biotin-dependent carboxyltransferase [Desulfurococcales archaeon]|nr:biotin-dependent carboxyltransferase [Desulfurococcales archaeon]
MSLRHGEVLVEEAFLATIQDMGRFGHRAKGIPVSGALDRVSAAYANVLVGNPSTAPVIEAVGGRIKLRFLGGAVVSVTGGVSEVSVNGVKVPMWEPLLVEGGSTLEVRGVEKGLTVYVGVSGGFTVEPVLGSASTYVRGGFGGLGRYLRRGDALQFLRVNHVKIFRNVEGLTAPKEVVNRIAFPSSPQTIRVTKGIHSSLFCNDFDIFLNSRYVVTTRSDRMGFRLEGPRLGSASSAGKIPSIATDRGYVQVPPDGEPIVLMSDAQTTGGYAVIAHVIPPDADLLAQCPPGTEVRFTEVQHEEAEEIVKKYLESLMNPPVDFEFPFSWGEVPPEEILRFR